jgi:hypothetical protein
VKAVPMDSLIDGDGDSAYGTCGYCEMRVDNFTPNHRVSFILKGGRGVECVLRGDIEISEAQPLGTTP